MLRKSPLVSLALFALLAINAWAQSVVLTPSTTAFNPAGGTITFTTSITYAGTPSVLAFTATLPTGWTYLSGANEPAVTPSAGNIGTLGWAYTSVPLPASPTTFTFTASYPANLTGLQPISTSLATRDSTESAPTTTTGPTLTLAAPPAAYNWNGDGKHTGNWNDPTLWSPAGTVPNNSGLATYSAQISTGTATIDSSTSITLNDLFLFGGSIDGGGLLKVVGANSSWTSGSIALSSFTIDAGAAFSAGTYSTHDFDGTTIRNQGVFNWRDGGALRSGNGGAFINTTGATFNDTTTGTSTDYLITNPFGGSFTFSNAGTYVKTTVGSTTRIEVPFTNIGLLKVDGGTLHFTSSFIQAGGTTRLASGTSAIFDSGVFLVGGSLLGTGTITGDVVNGSSPSNVSTLTANPGPSLASASISPGDPVGRLTIAGSLALLSTSQLLFDLAGTSQGTSYDFLSVSGITVLGGTLSITLQTSFRGTVSSATTFTLLSASSLSGSFDNVASGARLLTTDGTGTFLIDYSGSSITASNFQLVPVPEPSTWALMITGLGVIAASVYRRRKAT